MTATMDVQHTKAMAIKLAFFLSALMPWTLAQAEKTAVSTEALRTEVSEVREITVPVWLTTGGTVIADHRVSVSSRLSGYIRQLTVHEGQKVKKGQLLFRIDPVDALQALNQARADAEHALAEKKRYQALLEAQAVTRQQYDSVALRYTLAQSRLKQAENQLRYTDVRAALDGVVVSKPMHNGDLASPGQTVLVIENPRQLLVETYVSEGHIRLLHEGDAAELRFTGHPRMFPARIEHIIEDEHTSSHQFLVKLSLQADAGIRPGMFAHVRFQQGLRNAWVVPGSAVVLRNGLYGVYRVDTDGVLHYQLVRPGERIGEQIEISAGLMPGDRVLTHADQPVHTGMQLVGAVHE